MNIGVAGATPQKRATFDTSAPPLAIPRATPNKQPTVSKGILQTRLDSARDQSRKASSSAAKTTDYLRQNFEVSASAEVIDDLICWQDFEQRIGASEDAANQAQLTAERIREEHVSRPTTSRHVPNPSPDM